MLIHIHSDSFKRVTIGNLKTIHFTVKFNRGTLPYFYPNVRILSQIYTNCLTFTICTKINVWWLTLQCILQTPEYIMVIFDLEIGELLPIWLKLIKQFSILTDRHTFCKTKFIELRDISTNYQYSISHCTYCFFTNIQTKILYLKLLKVTLYRCWKVKIISWFKTYLHLFKQRVKEAKNTSFNMELFKRQQLGAFIIFILLILVEIKVIYLC